MLKLTGRICYGITSDNAHVIGSAIEELNQDISPKILHHMCGCHCVNLLLGNVIQKYKIMDIISNLKEKVEENKRKEGFIKIKKYTPTRWYSLGDHLESLLVNAKTFGVEYEKIIDTFKKLLEYFYELLHKLESNNATLVTEYEALVIFESKLLTNPDFMTEYTYDMYVKKYFPYYIDKASCISMAAYLTPRLKQDVIDMYGDIRGVEKEILENAERWNIEITLNSLKQYKSGEEPFIFDPKYKDQPMEQWERISIYCDSKYVSNLCEFYRILCSISPTETVVERAFSIEKFVHSSTRNRLSSERVEDIMTLKLNYDLWKTSHKFE